MVKKKNNEKKMKKDSKKSNSKKNVNNKGISKINRFNILFVDLQIFFTVLTIICIVWYFFDKRVWHVLQFVLGFTMFIIGYNNKIIYDRPKMSYVYYVIGAILIIFDILLLLGV